MGRYATARDCVEGIFRYGTECQFASAPGRPGELSEGCSVQCASMLSHLGEPVFELRSRTRRHCEAHIREPGPTKLRGYALVAAGLIDLKIKLRGHTRHGINLAAHLRDEEAVHHAGGCKAEVHRNAGWYDEAVDRGNVLLRINEEPSPIE